MLFWINNWRISDGNYRLFGVWSCDYCFNAAEFHRLENFRHKIWWEIFFLFGWNLLSSKNIFSCFSLGLQWTLSTHISLHLICDLDSFYSRNQTGKSFCGGKTLENFIFLFQKSSKKVYPYLILLGSQAFVFILIEFLILSLVLTVLAIVKLYCFVCVYSLHRQLKLDCSFDVECDENKNMGVYWLKFFYSWMLWSFQCRKYWILKNNQNIVQFQQYVDFLPRGVCLLIQHAV